MGQYYLPYVEHGNKIKIFDNAVDGEWQGLKLMEHSWWRNCHVGQVVNDLFYNKGRVCWVGDYFNDDNYSQVNCGNKELVKSIGELTWAEHTKRVKGTVKKARTLDNCLLVNHTKKIYINCNDYKLENTFFEEWDGEKYSNCIHPLPLLTCSANHSGGSFHGTNSNLCGTWFFDELEVVWDFEEDKYKKSGYKPFMTVFLERQ